MQRELGGSFSGIIDEVRVYESNTAAFTTEIFRVLVRFKQMEQEAEMVEAAAPA